MEEIFDILTGFPINWMEEIYGSLTGFPIKDGRDIWFIDRISYKRLQRYMFY